MRVWKKLMQITSCNSHWDSQKQVMWHCSLEKLINKNNLIHSPHTHLTSTATASSASSLQLKHSAWSSPGLYFMCENSHWKLTRHTPSYTPSTPPNIFSAGGGVRVHLSRCCQGAATDIIHVLWTHGEKLKIQVESRWDYFFFRGNRCGNGDRELHRLTHM